MVSIVPIEDVRPDSLRHYIALCRGAHWLAAGNGSHVPVVRAALEQGADLFSKPSAATNRSPARRCGRHTLSLLASWTPARTLCSSAR
jgi:hypothetical protein